MKDLWQRIWKHGVGFRLRFKFGSEGDPIQWDLKHCVDCGIMRKDHHGKDHRFREFTREE